jgi:Uma2 family endonuclease
MTTQPQPRIFTADEFIAWSMTQRGRFELVGGVVVEMAAEKVEHVRAKVAAFDALAPASPRTNSAGRR